MTQLVNAVKTMLSTEIAELCAKQHKNVLRDIETIVEQLEKDSSNLSSGFKSSTYLAGNGKQERCFSLDHDSTMLVITGYDAVVRMKVIKRWQELETQQSKPLSQLEMALIQMQNLVEQEKRLSVTEQRIEVIASKVDDMSIDLRNGVPHGFISKKMARVQSASGLSKEVFELALSDANVTTQKYIHYQEGQAISTFAYKEDEVAPAIAAFLLDAKQVTKQMCYSTKLNKRFSFIKEAV